MKIEKYYSSFVQVPLELLKDESLTATQKLIMSFIWSIAAYKDDNKAIIVSKVLEDITGLTRMNVYNNTKRLEELGYFSKALVTIGESTNKVTEYTLNLEYLLSKYGEKGMKVKLNTEETPKKFKNPIDKSTPSPYTYKSTEDRRARSMELAKKKEQELMNNEYRKNK